MKPSHAGLIRRAAGLSQALGTVVALGGLSACSDRDTAGTPTEVDAASIGVPPAKSQVESMDERFARVAAAVPAFAGFFFDLDGKPTVYLTDVRQLSAARAALAVVFSDQSVGTTAPRVRQAKHSFKRLKQWHDLLGSILASDGVVFTDIDESKNRLKIGVEGQHRQAQVEAALARLGVPREAVVIEETEAIEFRKTLREVGSKWGGVQISFPDYPNTCTLGFGTRRTAIPPSQQDPSFVTNSHCTNVQGGVENTLYYQPSKAVAPEWKIGNELLDPPYFSGGVCPSGKRCRYSDTALVCCSIWVSVEFVARTVSRSRTSGSITYASPNGSFRIKSEAASAFVGQELNKVGRTTGWTYGYVTSTCVNTNVSNSTIHLLCQNFVSGGSAGGDSGSPVFSLTGQSSDGQSENIVLHGILWGGIGTSTFVYSTMSNIERELGALTTSGF